MSLGKKKEGDLMKGTTSGDATTETASHAEMTHSETGRGNETGIGTGTARGNGTARGSGTEIETGGTSETTESAAEVGIKTRGKEGLV